MIIGDRASLVADGPFAGFLPGYDNEPYDEEAGGGGYYGAGIPETSLYYEARQLSGLDPLTPAQAAMSSGARAMRLIAVLGLLNGFLVDNSIADTSLVDFLNAVNTSDPSNWATVNELGVPTVGMGMDISIGTAGADARNPSTEGAGASVQDALVIVTVDNPYTFDEYGFDVGGFDGTGDTTAQIYSGALPPVPIPAVLTTYDEFQTPLAVVDPSGGSNFGARVFEINFQIIPPYYPNIAPWFGAANPNTNLAAIEAMPTPRVFIWFPTAPAPQQIAVVSKIGIGQYSVSVPSVTEAKLYLEPGP